MNATPGTGASADVDQLRQQLAEAAASATIAYRQSARMIRLLTVLGQPSSPEELIDQILVALSQVFAADIVISGRVAGDRLEIIGACGLAEGDPSLAAGWPLAGAAAETVRNGRETVQRGDLSKVDVPEPLWSLGLRSGVWVPVGDGSGTVDEILILFRRSAEQFDPTDLDVLTAVASRLRMAVGGRERSATVERLAQSAHRLASRLGLSSVLDEAVDLLPELLSADGASIAIVHDGTASLRAWSGVSEAVAAQVIPSAPPWSDPARVGGETAPGGGGGHVLAVPIAQDDETAAVLYVFRGGHRPFSVDDVGSANIFANYLSAALTNARLYDALRESEGSLRLITDSISDLVAVVDASGHFVYASPSHERELSLPVATLLGTAVCDLVHPEERPSVDAWLAHSGDGGRAEYRLHSGDGRWVWVESALRPAPSADDTFVLSSRVIDDRRHLEEELRARATHDPLTALANRVLAREWLDEMLSRKDESLVGVLFCDLDRFKEVNDRLGHEAGDELLMHVAGRLRGCVRRGDQLARLGGDEFLVLLDNAADAQSMREVGERVVKGLESPFHLDGEDVQISVSVGGVLGRRRDTTASVMLRDADAAMYEAKNQGRGRVCVFDDNDSHRLRQRLELSTHLTHALERGELSLHYQPIVELATTRIVGFEALARWLHPTRGFVPPDVFIPLAEETGAIVEIGEWVLGEACRQLAAWKKEIDGLPLRMNVNLSPNQVRSPVSASRALHIIRASGAQESDVWLEVTEHSSIRSDVAGFAATMRAEGTHFSLDDFGISYSNLSSLELLPVEELKIDRVFVQGLMFKDTDRGIVRAVLAIADSLGMSVIAEGIETREQMDALVELGCRTGQGYYFARPMPADLAHGLLGAVRGGLAPS